MLQEQIKKLFGRLLYVYKYSTRIKLTDYKSITEMVLGCDKLHDRIDIEFYNNDVFYSFDAHALLTRKGYKMILTLRHAEGSSLKPFINHKIVFELTRAVYKHYENEEYSM